MTSQDNSRKEQVPRAFLIAAGGLVAFTLLLVGVSRLTGFVDGAIGAKQAVAEQMVHFEDQPNGAIAVYDAGDGRLIETMAPGSNGFMRGTLRALVRERRLHGVTDRAPFRVVQGADGSLILHDPSTDRRLDLRAFGPTNARAFASLLPSGSDER